MLILSLFEEYDLKTKNVNYIIGISIKKKKRRSAGSEGSTLLAR